jgi:hypothetical protein
VTIPLALPKSRYVIATDYDAPLDWPNDLLMIERVEGMLEGKVIELNLDALEDSAAIRKTSFNTLVIPTSVTAAPWLAETTQLVVRYRANHPEIERAVANNAPHAVEIDLPHTHLEALCFFVGSTVVNALGMTPGSMHEGNNYAMKYEAAVAQLNDLGMNQQAASINWRLRDNNWA